MTITTSRREAGVIKSLAAWLFDGLLTSFVITMFIIVMLGTTYSLNMHPAAAIAATSLALLLVWISVDALCSRFGLAITLKLGDGS